MISKETALNAFRDYNELSKAKMISGSVLRLQIGDYEYIFNPDEINYVGNGDEFLIANLKGDGWTNHGVTVSDGVYEFDGASYLERENITLGGRDFQIRGTVYESATDMIQRRKIFELYTSDELNMSLYSSGAGKNLDFFVNCEGTLDNYAEPAILEREYNFQVVWRQETTRLILYVNGNEIYNNRLTGFSTAKTFLQLRLGGSIYHPDAYWKGTISEFKVYDGFLEA